MATCVSRAGVFGEAVTSAGISGIAKASADWLPPVHVAWVDPKTGRPTPIFARAMIELFERRIGGINAATVPQVSTAAAQAKAEASSVGVFANTVATYAEGIAQSVEATTTVAVDNGLTGATDIPSPPPRPAQYEP